MKSDNQKNYLNRITFSLGLGLLLLAGGCFDTQEDFTLNPDGSGKVVHECTFQAVNLNVGNDSQDLGKTLTNAVRELLQQAKGVDAWRDVSFKTLDDGRLYFRGTAYFKDLSKLDIPNQTMLEFDWTKTADGNGLLTLRTNRSKSPDEMAAEPKKAPAKDLSPEELTKRIKQQRASFQQSKPMMASILGPMKQSVVWHLPGKVSASSNFKKDDAGNLAIKFEGAKMLEVIEKLVNDDEWCRKHGGTGFDNTEEKPVMDAEFNQFIFGEKAPVSATVAVTAALFDYETEVAAAKTEFAQTQEALHVGASDSGGAALVSAPPATGGLKSIKMVGARLVTASDSDRDLRPFNEEVGYTVSLLAEFPGAVQSVADKTMIEVATADDGTSLLPESEFDRQAHFPSLAKDKTAAILEFKLTPPGSAVKGLKELSGRVQYQVSSEAKEMDLGFAELKNGATGKSLGASIEAIRDGSSEGSQEIDMHLETNPDGLKAMNLVADGKKTELRQSGYGGGNNSYTFTFESKQPFPANGKLVAEVYSKVQVFEAPFKLENLTLLGASAEK